ncbi:FAD/NAD(P)-binding domain-containing protein [Whalleya microplaca]|nr:FAD/NAD(P)-binding domain-containing protein [Whalleya microplaca]
MPSKRPFKIIVVGGGITGLTLANMLEKFDLEYVLLEAHEDIHPPQGAAIGLMPNGSFIMDQLGCYEAIKAAVQNAEIEDSHIRDSNGKSFMSLKHMYYHQEKRHGYPMLFFDRQLFLKVLYDQLKHKDRVRLRNRVDRIKQLEDGIQVTTKEGSSYLGDIVIGADGIHSSVRKEMRRIADSIDPNYFNPSEEEKVPSYYQCSFGIAQDVENWPGGEQCFVTGRGKAFLVVSGPGGRCYWFLFVKYPEVKYGKNIPKYSNADEMRFVKEHEGLAIKENVTFGQVYTKRVTSALTALHEVIYKKWFFGRILLIGDSVHKSNPIGGMGANSAIETAAEFLSTLLDMNAERQNTLDSLNADEIQTIFERVQDARFERAAFTISASHELQSLAALENPILATVALRLLMPLSGKHNFFRELSNRIVGASRLRHLDLPSCPRAIPYDHELPAKPLKALPNRVARGLFCFVMVLMIYTANITMSISYDERESWRKLVSWGGNWLGVDMLESELDSTPRAPLIYLLTHMMSPLIIYTVEGYRIGRHGTIISLPVLFVASIQVLGIGRSVLLYALLSAIHSAQTTVDRPVRVEVARSLLPALAFGFIVPMVLLIAPMPSVNRWQGWIRVSPLWFSALNSIFSSTSGRWQRRKSDEDADKHAEWYSTDDVPILNTVYDLAFAVQATAHLGTLTFTSIHAGLSLATVPRNALGPFNTGSRVHTSFDKAFAISKYELLWTIAGVVSHSLYLVWELRRQGYITTSRALRVALVVTLGQVIVGPGASWAGIYRWRENIISELSSSSSSPPSSRLSSLGDL